MGRSKSLSDIREIEDCEVTESVSKRTRRVSSYITAPGTSALDLLSEDDLDQVSQESDNSEDFVGAKSKSKGKRPRTKIVRGKRRGKTKNDRGKNTSITLEEEEDDILQPSSYKPTKRYNEISDQWNTTSDDEPDQDAMSSVVNVHLGADKLDIDATVFGSILSAFVIIRSFSWLLKVKPFLLEEFCFALYSKDYSILLNTIFTGVLRALAIDETASQRALRNLNLKHLDDLTWPIYLWELLLLNNSPYAKHFNIKVRKSDKEIVKNIKKEVNLNDIAMPMEVAQGEVKNQGESNTSEFLLSDVEGKEKFLMKREPFLKSARKEFVTVSGNYKALILEALCNDLLDTSSFRKEIENREAEGQDDLSECSKGTFTMRSLEERKARAKGMDKNYHVLNKDNADACVLCNGFGNLLCCNACPAVYHLECLGWPIIDIASEAEWLCPECKFGGKGELAALRVPLAGLDKAGHKHYLLFGQLYREGIALRTGRGRKAVEALVVPINRHKEDGPQRLLKLKYPDDFADEKFTQASVDQLSSPSSAILYAVYGPKESIETYENAWKTFSVEQKKYYDYLIRRRGRQSVGSAPVPCLSCPCHFPYLQYTSSLEQMKFALLDYSQQWEFLFDDSWKYNTIKRQSWEEQVKVASTIKDLIVLLKAIECAVRSDTFDLKWNPKKSYRPSLAFRTYPKSIPLPPDGMCKRRVSRTPRRWTDPDAPVKARIGRPPRIKKKLVTNETELLLSLDRENFDVVSNTESEKYTNWSIWYGGTHSRWRGKDTLPHEIARKLARSGACRRIPSVSYNSNHPTITPRTAWQAACESAQTVAELAVQLYELQAQMNWSDLTGPTSNNLLSLVNVLEQKDDTVKDGYKYLVKLPEIANLRFKREINNYKDVIATPNDVLQSLNGNVSLPSKSALHSQFPSDVCLKENTLVHAEDNGSTNNMEINIEASKNKPFSYPTAMDELVALLERGDACWVHESSICWGTLQQFYLEKKKEHALNDLVSAIGKQDVRGTMKVKQLANNYYNALCERCAACGEAYNWKSINKIWISCKVCLRWYHQDCECLAQDASDFIQDLGGYECDACWLKRTSFDEKSGLCHLKKRMKVTISEIDTVTQKKEEPEIITSDELTWMKKAQEVLDEVMELENAAPFIEKVTDDIAPEYSKIIKSPMDFGLIKEKLMGQQYTTKEEMLSDINLVWTNCHTYNEDGHEITVMCDKLRQSFEELWKLKGPSMDDLINPDEENEKTVLEDKPLNPDQANIALQVIHKIVNDKTGQLFLDHIKCSESATDVSKCLHTIVFKIKENKYTVLGEIFADINSLWQGPASATNFASKALKDAVQKKFISLWEDEGLFIESKLLYNPLIWEEALTSNVDPASVIDFNYIDGDFSKSKASAEANSSDCRLLSNPKIASSCIRVLRSVIRDPISSAFCDPVTADDAPDYHLIIKHPMTLKEILLNIKQKKYEITDEVLEDVGLIWTNCQTYNDPDSDIVADCLACKKLFDNQWAQASLPELETIFIGSQRDQKSISPTISSDDNTPLTSITKKRGRPKKNIHKDYMTPGYVKSNTSSNWQSGVANTRLRQCLTEPPKKRRGRPPKSKS